MQEPSRPPGSGKRIIDGQARSNGGAERAGEVATAKRIELALASSVVANGGTKSGALLLRFVAARDPRSIVCGMIPRPAASSSAVKKPAQPSRIDKNGSPATVASSRNRNRIVCP